MARWLAMLATTLIVCGCATAAARLEVPAPWDSFRVGNAYRIFENQEVADLAIAAAKGDVEQMARLVSDGVDINASGEYGQTPLFWAFYAHNKNGFAFLLKHGADPNARDENGDGMIHLAAADEDPTYLRLALDHGGDPNLRDTRGIFPTPIFRAIEPIKNDNLKLLIDRGANVDFRDAAGETPIMAAADLNNYSKVYLLLVCGADFRLKDFGGNSIIWNIEHASFDEAGDTGHWRTKVVAFLRQHGIEVHPRNP